MKDIQNLIQQYGVENLRLMIKMHPLRKAFFITYTSSNDPLIPVMCKIVEDRYKLKDNYKIEVKSENEAFGKESFYISDLNHLIRDKQVRVFAEL